MRFITAKNIFIVLGVLIFLELVWTVWQLTRSLPPVPPPAVVEEPKAKLKLLADKQTVVVGEKVMVDIILDTAGHLTDGADVILTFDPTLVSVPQPVKTGVLYQSYPAKAVESNRVVISGVSGIDAEFRGTGVFATVTFEAKKAGQVNLEIEYQQNSTADSNITESGTTKDLLEKIEGVTINII